MTDPLVSSLEPAIREIYHEEKLDGAISSATLLKFYLVRYDLKFSM